LTSHVYDPPKALRSQLMNFQPLGHWKEYAPLTFRTLAGQVMIVPAVASGVGEGDGLDDAFGAVLTDDGDVEGPLAVRPGAAQAADRLTRTTSTAMRMTMKRQVSGLVSAFALPGLLGWTLASDRGRNHPFADSIARRGADMPDH
jgi:hypothetical protein